MVLGLFLLSCRAQHVDADVFRIGIESFPRTLDPRLAADASSSKLCQLIYAGLFRVDKNLELEKNLLESYQVISATQYRFTLRPAILFHDGSVLTSADVAWTYQSILDGQLLSPHRSTFSKIKKLRMIDERSFEITLQEPFAPFLSALTMGIVQKNAVTPKIGAGPFRFVEQVADEKVVLERFEHYFAPLAKPRQLIFRVIREDNLRVMELVRGHLDLLQNTVPPALIPYVQKQDDLRVFHRPGINYAYMGFNLEDPVLSQEKVRQAIAYALDRETIIEHKLKGMARPATGVLAPMHWAFHEAKHSTTYDPQKARALLDEVGFKDPDGDGPQSRFKLLYKTSTKRDRVAMAQLIALYLKQVGIEVVVTPFEWGTLFRDIRNGNFQLYTLTWVGVTEPDIYHYIFNTSQIPPHGANRNRYRNERIDLLTDQGRLETDQEKRKTFYAEVQEILAQELPYINLWYEDVVVVSQKNIKGYESTPDASFWGLMGLYRE